VPRRPVQSIVDVSLAVDLVKRAERRGLNEVSWVSEWRRKLGREIFIAILEWLKGSQSEALRRPRKSDQAVAKLSYGGGMRRSDRRSWMLGQG
jgi:hypothetical protein